MIFIWIACSDRHAAAVLASPYDRFQEYPCRLHRPLLPPFRGLRLQPRLMTAAPPSPTTRTQESDTGGGGEYLWVTPNTNPPWYHLKLSKYVTGSGIVCTPGDATTVTGALFMG